MIAVEFFDLGLIQRPALRMAVQKQHQRPFTRSDEIQPRAIADRKGVYVDDLTVIILSRPRHEKLIAEVRQTGARIKLIGDGDVSAAIAT